MRKIGPRAKKHLMQLGWEIMAECTKCNCSDCNMIQERVVELEKFMEYLLENHFQLVKD